MAVSVFVVPKAECQLRPLEPIHWKLISGAPGIGAEAGVSRLSEQRASLAGSEGDLWELGNFALGWRTGRVLLEAAGTFRRQFTEHATIDEPYTDVEPATDGKRDDSGDYRISTTVRLTPRTWPVIGVVRFGTRLPTTDNTKGLDRDAIDFFSTVGASGSLGPVTVNGETGLGIYTTREQRFEQDDLFLYALHAELRGCVVTPSIAALGQLHGATHSAIRGLENLGELRGGLTVGKKRWIRVEVVKGYETFSPATGVIVSAGVRY